MPATWDASATMPTAHKSKTPWWSRTFPTPGCARQQHKPPGRGSATRKGTAGSTAAICTRQRNMASVPMTRHIWPSLIWFIFVSTACSTTRSTRSHAPANGSPTTFPTSIQTPPSAGLRLRHHGLTCPGLDVRGLYSRSEANYTRALLASNPRLGSMAGKAGPETV